MDKLYFQNNFVVNLSPLLSLRGIVRRSTYSQRNTSKRKQAYTKDAIPFCLSRETDSVQAINPLQPMIQTCAWKCRDGNLFFFFK